MSVSFAPPKRSEISLQEHARTVEKNRRFVLRYSGRTGAVDLNSIEIAVAQRLSVIPSGTIVRVFGFPPIISGGRGWIEAEVIEHVWSSVPGEKRYLVRVRSRETSFGARHLVDLEDVEPYSAIDVLVEQHRKEVGRVDCAK